MRTRPSPSCIPASPISAGTRPPPPVLSPAASALGRSTREADILVSAAGSPGIIQPDMVKPGAVVVSGGQTFNAGRTLLPDVDESVAEVASWITPRLGGVGPTTIVMLLRNTVEAAERRSKHEQ